MEIIKFSSKTCSPCKALQEYLTNNNLEVTSVDVEDDYEAAMKHNIRAVPTLIKLLDGEEVDRITGFNNGVIDKVDGFFHV